MATQEKIMIPALSDIFTQLKLSKRKALMPFLTSGYPDGKTFVKLMATIAKSGADIIEVGIPFSDPLADGSTIQKSSQKALEHGVDIDKTFEYLSGLKSFETPVIIMSYLNPIYQYGINKFVKKAYQAGVRGLIVPDLIVEEGKIIEQECRTHGLELVYLLAPTTSPKRTEIILSRSRGFVYLVSISGVTGARKSLPSQLGKWIKIVKRKSSLPVCVGFGISDLEQAKSVSRSADGVIIGSAIINRILSAGSKREMLQSVSEFIIQIRKGIDRI